MTKWRRISDDDGRRPAIAHRLRPTAPVEPDVHDREARYLLERAELQRRRARSGQRGQRPPR